MLFDFMGFWFLVVLLSFHYWDNSWVSIVIFRYMWWFEIVSFNYLVGFYLSKHWVFIVFRSTGRFDDLVQSRVSLVIRAKNGFIEWLKRFLKQSRTNIRFVWWELQMCIDKHENMLLWFGGCGYLTLRTLSFDYFTLFSLCVLLLKSPEFGTRLKYD